MQSRDIRVFWIITLVAFVLVGSYYLNTRGIYNYEYSTESPAITTLIPCPPGGATYEDFIRARLHEAELIWKRGVETRHKTEIEHPSSVANPWSGQYLTLMWDFFYPTFNCPHLIERLGKVGDGGKWVCGVSHLAKHAKNCVVYSYGVAGDTSFEQDVLSRTSCTLRAFDHTVDSNNVALTKEYPTRSSFDKIGLGSTDTGNVRTLKTEMNRHGDEFIDILKVDVEGGEFELFRQIMNDFPNGFPFGQLLIEIHVDALSRTDQYAKMKSWWEALENAGLRPFNREPNLFILYLGAKDPTCFEYSFLNVKIDHTLLHG